MRRKEKQIIEQKLIEKILEKNTICRIGFVDGEKPYLIPLNYGYNDNKLYVHTALKGKKIEILKKNNNVCVEITDSIEIVTSELACHFGTRFRSVLCNGKIYPVIELEEKVAGLKIIMKQHTGNDDWDIPEAVVEKILVLKVEIDSMTGKISGL